MWGTTIHYMVLFGGGNQTFLNKFWANKQDINYNIT
jgi:hypothetical protein